LRLAKSDILLKQSDICPFGASDIFPCGKVMEEIENRDCFVALILAMTGKGIAAGLCPSQ